MQDSAGARHAEKSDTSSKPYRVLSLDGGGTRGIYTAAFLDRLLAQFAARTGRAALDLGLAFDLITGTSTGAIVGSAAAIGAPMADIVDLYRNHGPAIFPHRIKGFASAIYRACTGGYYVRKGDQALRAALAEVLGDTTMADVFAKRGISLSIPAVRMSTHKAYVFKKTPKSGTRDDGFRLADVCLASSAAPIYRSLAAIDAPGGGRGGKQVFADGGLWANNPIMVGLTDALTIAGPHQPIEIFSLGTCPRPEGEHIVGDKVHRSMLRWRLGADVAPLGISAQEFAYDNMARLIANAISDCGRSICRVRFPNKDVPASMMDYLALDDARPDTMDRLIQQAHTDADMTLSACDDPKNPDGRLIRGLLEDVPVLDPARTLVRARFLPLPDPQRIFAMFDCSKDITAYHDQKVTLPQVDRTAMRDRRDSNRDRLRKGLAKAEDPAPDEFVKQGSYAMKTMLRDDNNDYDIDDGVYFSKAVLVGARGAEMTSLQARQMVRDGVDDGSFDRAPEVRGNCVRIFYKKGYHVDMPVYRKVEENGQVHYELAAAGGWKRSDARDVTAWYDDARNGSSDGPQMRRLTRMLKKFGRSRSSWAGRMLSGFGITALVVEKNALDVREDRALYDTMKAVRDRLNWDLVIKHPVTPADTITSGSDDSKAKMLRDKLTEALGWLAPLFNDDCTRNEALECWDKVFNTTFFSERGETESRAAASYATPIVSAAAIIGLESRTAASVNTAGGGRHA